METLEQQIVRLYKKNLVDLYSINQIAKKLSKKYPYINKKVGSLVSSGILKKMVVGRSHLCSLNLENPYTLVALSSAEISLQKKIPSFETIKKGIDDLKYRISLLIVISYGKKLVFVLESLRDRREVDHIFPGSIVIDRRQFLDLLLDDRELYENSIVLYGYEKYYELVTYELDEIKRRYSPLRY